jgi:hypothetical protein
MRMRIKLSLAVVIAVTRSAVVSGESISSDLETPALLQHLHGTLIVDKPPGGIAAIDLPSLRVRDLRSAGDQKGGIVSLSGPDADGQVAFVTSGRGLSHTYVVNLLYSTGVEEKLFIGAGDPLWDGAISPLALAPHGLKIAFVSQPPEDQNKHFQQLVTGPLQYWDSRTKNVHNLSVIALGLCPSWFPDGHRLAYATPVVGPHVEEAPLPRVHIIDTDSEVDSILTKGSLPLVSSDGRTVLVERRRGRFVLVDVASRSERVFSRLPGLTRTVALVASRYLIYIGPPTPGMPTGETSHNSPFVGPKPIQAIKLIDLDTREFVTLVPWFDPRGKVAVFINSVN